MSHERKESRQNAKLTIRLQYKDVASTAADRKMQLCHKFDDFVKSRNEYFFVIPA
jgi:hypothetical protein